MTPSRCEDGNVPAVAVLFGMLSIMFVTSLAGRFVVEYRQVDDSLADVRAYWAAMAFNNYALSRTAQSGQCSSSSCADTTVTGIQQGYLGELQFLLPWEYPDVGTYYQFYATPTASIDPLAPSGHTDDLLIKSTFATCPVGSTCSAPGSGSPPTPVQALRSLLLARPVEFRYCLIAPSATTCGGGASKIAPPSGGYLQLVSSMHRP